ncbi:MAG: LamG domain-containing protein, partial [Minisyncoccia bacterium]
TGWIPIDFTKQSFGKTLSKLPIDPINQTSTGNYYTYATRGSWELTTRFESQKYILSQPNNDGGIDPALYEVGTNLSISPFVGGLVGYWSFDEGSGTTAYDMSGNGNNGTLVNGPTWTTGKVGGALSFDGVDDYVNINSVNPFRNPFTVSVWVRFNAVNKGSDNAILGHGSATLNNGLHLGERRTRGYFGFYSNDIQSNSTLLANMWYHISFIYDGRKKIYINGVLDASGASNVYQSTALNAEIGRYPWSTGWLLNGLIDEVRIYNRALSDAEIQAIYNATK